MVAVLSLMCGMFLRISIKKETCNNICHTSLCPFASWLYPRRRLSVSPEGRPITFLFACQFPRNTCPHFIFPLRPSQSWLRMSRVIVFRLIYLSPPYQTRRGKIKEKGRFSKNPPYLAYYFAVFLLLPRTNLRLFQK